MNFQSSSSRVLVLLFSRLITAVVGIIFVPLYVKLIGAESYGLVTFYGTLLASFSLLDLGLSTAISRQVAILKIDAGNKIRIHNLLFSVELIYWGIALLVGVGIFLLAHPIAVYWVNAEKLPVAEIENAVKLMGLVFAVQFPSSIYNGTMIGLEKQVYNAVLTVIFAIVKSVGVLLVLVWVDKSVTGFFIWQALVTFALTISLRIMLFKLLHEKDRKPVFSTIELKAIWKFAAGMTGIALITFFLMQIDKIVVSKWVTLKMLAYYNLAFMMAGALNQLLSPLQPVLFPRLSALIAEGNRMEWTRLYHTGCRWISVIVLPLGLTLVLFADEILWMWTGNTELTAHTAPILRVVASGTMLNCLMWMPYLVLLAHGNTRFTIIQNLLAALVLVPLLFWWVIDYGALGASFVWLTVNAGYVIVSIPLFHKWFMKHELGKWYLHDVAYPLIVASLLGALAKLATMLGVFESRAYLFLVPLALAGILYVLVIPELRRFVNRQFSIFSA